ncbi:hypothetical protein SAMD00019534_126540 [Acytostelium subglobosum LB1]|uniref:hypothetical protein n=1 Tax=Acytostelium subglobosum LB1 TaxID=1410327 RepID=UPI000644FC63|nr:hypothetical protein SAMD00019534_126540 [Acytostelium subglobosum LB1]GAM29478.1 hypothetical protein SAMD00019534_126540 [Acytostelium subglobosum LB1]|eukprot:XP_012747573.1 hypothetical protein SAMD00019534_126540 [Acytostelium subglobosum LB1]
MEEWMIILIGAIGGLFIILLAVVIAYCVARSVRSQEYEPLEKGNVFVYERDNSQQIKEDTIMMNARFYLRSTMYTLDRHLPLIGSRTDKNYFSVIGNSPNRAENDRVLSMVPISKNWPLPLYTENGRQTYRTIIKSMELHPFISTPHLVDFLPDKMVSVSIRPFYARGSLRDYIHQAKPKSKYSEKYQQQYQLNDKLISRFGRQILEALLFLKYHNMPYFHLNASNILMDDNTCLISDYENAFLGLRPRLSKFLSTFSDKMDPEVLCFGCILYEMGCGYEMESPDSIELGLPGHCHPEVKKILESIFRPMYGVAPTLEELTKLNFFSEWKFKNLPIQRVTFSTKEREMIDAASKLNRAYITQQKVDDIPKLKKLKKQKKRKTLTFVPMEVTLNPTTSSSIPTSFSSYSSSSSLASSYSTTSLNNQVQKTNSSNNLAASTSPTSVVQSAPPAPPAAPKPPPPPPAPPASSSAPPPPPPPPAASSSGGGDRRGLLTSIESFRSGSLKKTKTKDRSSPKL